MNVQICFDVLYTLCVGAEKGRERTVMGEGGYRFATVVAFLVGDKNGLFWLCLPLVWRTALPH